MKITTWNVNGLRALLRKNGWEWIRQHDADIICLQEIKARPEQLTPDELALFAPYQACWNPADRPGYSGTLTLVKNIPVQFETGLGVPLFDTEGRVVKTFFENIILFNIYFPNGGRDHSRVPFKLDFYAELLHQCDALHSAGRHLIICGDINTAHQEIDLKNPKSNQNTTGFLPEERAWVSKYLESGFVDVFRNLYPKKIQYTWWSYIGSARARNVGWRLDYFLASTNLVPQVSSVMIHDDVPGSDHCPVTLHLETRSQTVG